MGLGSFNDFDWNFGDDTYSDEGFDWGSAWGDIGQDGSTWDWLNDLDGGGGEGGSGGGGGWSQFLNWGSSFFGGNGGQQGGNIWGAMLGGLGSAAQAYMDREAVEEAGRQSRRTLDFRAALEDYYAQKDKVRRRAALDTFGQFSTMDRWAPNATPAPGIDMPNKPGY